ALAAGGAEVVRIEHPDRPDGLRRGDPALWRRLNGAKRLLVADAATEAGRREVAEALRWADLVVSGHSPRVLPQLGFTPAWFRDRAPRAALLELVAYLPPHEGLPGLGEHAAAVAGLLWAGARRPRPPWPWADPLAGALCAALALAWDAVGGPSGARLRVSLEGAARLALAPAC
ncbi:MAG TPA: CoA transferase, partial [Candidatus Dormibacteraeota bacterium]